MTGEIEWDVDITLADNLTGNKGKALPAGNYIVQCVFGESHRCGYAKSAGIFEEVCSERYVCDHALTSWGKAVAMRGAGKRLATKDDIG